ncbi:SIR2 family protein [Photobacterium sp. J15]|uniref:SIR2 family protein n=1 Tax=Photobacterium sp. J15 TaxID=265901 RepID=UPI0007E3C4FC|nr:SIR2 family protein [Photobacterium sp. J15]
MSRSLIVFGNGLGMALDHRYFSLTNALETIWEGTEHFDAYKKQLIIGSIDGLGEHNAPQGEHQLEKLQIAIVVTDYLKKLEVEGGPRWLSEHASDLPQAYNKFIHEVAFYFHQSGEFLPNTFLNPLADYIRESKSHVATLNYDNLLYDGLKNKNILNGFDLLIDGFTRTSGFTSDNLNRFSRRNQAWYMHLHGSPLYQGDRKLLRDERDNIEWNEKSHIVLTHIKHKPMIIDSSDILREYWKRLPRAITEAEVIILFGYSGNDTHLNRKITEHAIGKKIHIIEYSGVGTPLDRSLFWNSKFIGFNVEVHLLDSVIDFTEWTDLR